MNSRFFFLVVFFIFCSNIFANSLQGNGKAYIHNNTYLKKAQKQALLNAKIDVLTKHLTFSEDLINKNWQNLQQHIFTNPNKYLKVTKTNGSTYNGEYFMEIQAVVNNNSLQRDLVKFKILQSINKKEKVLLIYYPQELKSFELEEQVTAKFISSLSNKKGYISIFFDLNLNKRLIHLGLPLLLEKVAQLGYTSLVIVDLYTITNEEQNFTFQKHELGINSNIYELEIGMIKEKKVLLPIYYNAGKELDDYKYILDFHLEQLNQLFFSYLDNYLSNYYALDRVTEIKKYTLEFEFFSQGEQETIDNILKNIIGYQKSNLQTLGSRFKILYFSALSSTRLYYTLTFSMNKNNLNFSLLNFTHNKIKFSKN